MQSVQSGGLFQGARTNGVEFIGFRRRFGAVGYASLEVGLIMAAG